ncbi:MAG: antitoxin [Oscillospiraceae bacterium]|jgi:hypothetical protein|nr:antitoxin [Oscillospiraceae bacterium]
MGRTSSAVKDRYNAKAYDEIKVRVNKGRKAEIQSYAEAHGQSVNGFINRAIDETMERDKEGGEDIDTQRVVKPGGLAQGAGNE